MTFLCFACDDGGWKSLPPPAETTPPSKSLPREDKPVEPPPAPDVSSSKCFKAATKLYGMAKQCGIAIGDRTATKTCTELFTEDKFTDEQAIGRLEVFMRDGCAKLRLAVENDRL